ncbi:F-box only protein 5 [Eucyclogobius newberryi]|uniref:F-box only protein 5 n=1 Tax=Eucyclogobius newberryi TaxID=166745 RepID=UPI003B5BF1A8
MTNYKKANMKVPSSEPSWPNNVDKSSAVDGKVEQLHGSPVKEHIFFKAPFPAVDVTPLYPQNIYTRAVDDKENAACIDQGHNDSGYLSLQNSHIEEEEEGFHGHPTTVLSVAGAVSPDKRVTPRPSKKCQETGTSQSDFTPVHLRKKRTDTCSRSSTPADHKNLPILQFTQEVCEKLSKNFQKTKRYDWSIVSKLAENYNLDRVIGGHMGVDHVDMFSSLLSRNMKSILVQILGLLGDMDLISCRKVSKTWRHIIHEDIAALRRCRQAEKALTESELPLRLSCGLTRDASLSRLVLSSMQRVACTHSSPSQPSPAQLKNCRTLGNSSSSLTAERPNCTRFNQYVEAARTLKQHESLQRCKRCGSPATHSREAQRATCTRSSCQFDFCTGCHEAFHDSTPCRMVNPRPHFMSKSSILPGSTRSKRNVRRL